MEIQVNNTDECIKSFALSIEEHMKEFIKWQKTQKNGDSRASP